MGSGSGGGGGSGAGAGGGGGGGTWSAAGRYEFHGRTAAERQGSENRLQKSVRETFAKLARNREYVLSQVANPLVEAAYHELFRLKIELVDNKAWTGVRSAFGVEDGPGCLQRWVRAVLAAHQQLSADQRLRAMLRVALDDFLLKALQDDLDAFADGDSKAVMAKLDTRVLKSTSGYFLGFLLGRLLYRETERLAEAAEMDIQGVAQEKADVIIGSFEQKYHDKNQTTYRDLFSVIRQNPDWFIEKLKS